MQQHATSASRPCSCCRCDYQQQPSDDQPPPPPKRTSRTDRTDRTGNIAWTSSLFTLVCLLLPPDVQGAQLQHSSAGSGRYAQSAYGGGDGYNSQSASNTYADGRSSGSATYTYDGNAATGRNQISCYSCMSKFYEANWPILQNIYNRPRNFTDDCDFHADRPDPQRNVGLVKCDSVCIKMYEQSQIGGLYVNGFTRGCYDNMMRRGFNATLVKWYRWLQRDSCHEYSRRQVLQLGPHAPDGVVTICTCYADGCNGTPRLSDAASGVHTIIRLTSCLAISLYVIHANANLYSFGL